MTHEPNEREYAIAEAANVAVFNAMRSVLADNKDVDPETLITMIVSGAVHGLAGFSFQCAPDPNMLKGSLGPMCDNALAEMLANAH